jgi:hypothetical protein
MGVAETACWDKANVLFEEKKKSTAIINDAIWLFS